MCGAHPILGGIARGQCQGFDVALEKWWKSNTDLCSSSNPGVCAALFLSFGKDDPGSGDGTTLLLSGSMLALSLSHSSTGALSDPSLAPEAVLS